MRVCVLGHRGMLGHVVARHLAECGCAVSVVEARFVARSAAPFLDALHRAEADWYVNCIGLRPGPAVPRERLFEVNTELPGLCARALAGKARLVQASTDGVFRPDGGARTVAEAPDATDDYGLSKRRGESLVLAAGGLVLRCSIVGPELGEPRSLLGWFLRQNAPVRGFPNQLWNGITTLQWARVCWEAMQGRVEPSGGIVQPGIWPAVSKLALLRLFAQVWGHAFPIEEAIAPTEVSRVLIPTLPVPPLEVQLAELRRWYGGSA